MVVTSTCTVHVYTELNYFLALPLPPSLSLSLSPLLSQKPNTPLEMASYVRSVIMHKMSINCSLFLSLFSSPVSLLLLLNVKYIPSARKK